MSPKLIEIICSGYSVAADWYDGKNSDEILLVLIGWTSKKSNQQDLVSAIVNATGKSALVFDYSGHGDSPFKLEETRPAQHFLEVIYAFDWLKDNYPDASISVMGTSYGGFLATQLTKYREFEKLVLRVPAIYKPSDFYTKWSDDGIDVEWTRNVFRKDVDALSKHPLLARASNFTGKTLVVVHDQDELVPKETTDAYIKTFSADTYIAEGFKHSFDPSLPAEKITAYQNAITQWLKNEQLQSYNL